MKAATRTKYVLELTIIKEVEKPKPKNNEILIKVKRDYPDIQVILITGHGSEKEGEEGLRVGAYDYLMKPIGIERLIRKIEEAASI